MQQVPYTQPTPAPTPKMAAVGISGSLTVIVVYALEAILDMSIPAEVATALTALILFAAGYFTRDRKPAEAIPIIRGESGVV